MFLIPTARKEKLPKGFSYPLGAQAVCGALDGVPQLEGARLWFCWRDEYWASEWRAKLEALGDVTLLEVTDSYIGHGRDLRLYAVPSEYSVAAREQLIAELPRVRRALLAKGSASKYPRVSIALSLARTANQPDRANRRQPIGFRERIGHARVGGFMAAVAHPGRWAE